MSITIPAGTRIYLTKNPPFELFLKPDTSLLNDSLYVAYDVRINGVVAIPKGTRVLGNWITETTPTIAAQLQLTLVYLSGHGQAIFADSNVYEVLSSFNSTEVNNSNYILETLNYISTANIDRRIVKAPCNIVTLLDDEKNINYIEIPTREIFVTLQTDFTYNSCLA